MKLNNEQVKALVNIVSHYTGFKFPDGLNAELLSHLESGLAHINKDPEELIGLVERFSFNPVRVLELIQPILDEVLIGETYFFRDYEAYDLLAAEVLPELVKQFGAYKRSLRVWSAGCSSGEEAYSLSIFLNKYFAGKDWQIDILGTDLNKSRLEKARQAVYGLNSFRHQSRFKEAFTPVEGRGNLQVKEEYRRNVQFKCLNLLENTSQPLKTDLYMYDLIFCRNVFIYFDQKTIKAVAKRLYQTLAPGGFLVITPSEYSKELFEDFEIIDTVNYRILRRPLLVKN
jgi:chemotaxis protein methyltransferase CheR